MSARLPVLVVGAGPIGLIFTIWMLKNGIPVRLVEKSTAFHGGARGTALQPRSLEALAFLDVLDDVLKSAGPPLLMAIYGPDGHTAKKVTWSQEADDSPAIPYRSSVSTSQAIFEGVLRDHVQKLGGIIETGVELIGLKQDDHKVTARLVRHAGEHTGQEQEAECEFLIGADGAKGRTRHYAGIAFLGETKESERLLSANVYATGADRECWNTWGSFATASVGLKPLKPEPLFQLQSLGPELPEVYPTDLEGVRALFYSISKRADIQINAVEWASEWRANIRMAETFGAGKIFLAGDAAHCHSPFGGQGMNSGILDAVNLAWKITLVYKGRASPALLSTYDAERIPVIAEMLDLSTEIHSRAYGRLEASALDGVSNATAAGDVGQVMQRNKRLLQLGVNYRWSPIVIEDRTNDKAEPEAERNPYGKDSDYVRAGDRAPDAPELVEVSSSGERTSQALTLFNLFDIRSHMILVFSQGVGMEMKWKRNITGLAKYQQAGLGDVVVLLPRHTTAPTAAAVRAIDIEGFRVFVDSGGHSWKGYGVGDSEEATHSVAADTFVVVRPDGVIGAFAQSQDAVDLYFSKLLA